MIYQFDSDILLKKEILEITQIREEMKKDRILPLIRPYLSEGPLFKETKEELFYRWEAVLGPEEAREICKRECPDVPSRLWNGLILTYIIEWNAEFPLFREWDYVTQEMINSWGMTESEMFEIAVQNTDRLLSWTLFGEMESFELYKFKHLKVYKLFYDNEDYPKIGSIVMTSEKILTKIREKIGTDFYFLPLEMNKTYLIGVDDIEKKDLPALQEDIKDSILFKGPVLTMKKYVFRRNRLETIE